MKKANFLSGDQVATLRLTTLILLLQSTYNHSQSSIYHLGSCSFYIPIFIAMYRYRDIIKCIEYAALQLLILRNMI